MTAAVAITQVAIGAQAMGQFGDLGIGQFKRFEIG